MIPPATLNALAQRGVDVPDPGQVWIDSRIDPDRIQGPGTILYPGTRLQGEGTYISPGVRIGAEGPATVADSVIGPEAAVCSGFCRGAVLLAGARLGANAHVRPGTILEEGARTAHAVGLKQTILFPFVTLGSLINFCDCLMAGGTGPDNHSEVGSGYIHFNFTPHQDKATASLMGDVPGGVMLDQEPIFLGGQGGMVGPCRLAFGTVAAAGTLIRKDEPRPGRLLLGGSLHQGSVVYKPCGFRGLRRILLNNLTYIGNLMALGLWYRRVRRELLGPRLPAPVWQALVANLDLALEERIRRLEQLGQGLVASGQAHIPGNTDRAWPALVQTLRAMAAAAPCDEQRADRFFQALEPARKAGGGDYLGTIRALSSQARDCGRAWLQTTVDRTVQRAMAHVSDGDPPPGV